MSFNFKRKKLCRHLLVGGALFAAGFGVYSCTDTYDLDAEQPSGLNSLFGYMENREDYTNFLQLIKDLGQDTIMSRTGSKTLFIANDDAFAEFYKSNDWGVHSYADLTMTQKQLLLSCAMIDNPVTTSQLGTAVGMVKGEVCRRNTSQSLYDSVDYVSVLDPIIPSNSHWDPIRQRGGQVVLFRDASAAPPVVHFTPKFVSAHKFESTDIDFLYNLAPGTRQSGDTYVGNAKITNENIFCLNGFIHEVDRVMTPLDNMAEIIRKKPQTSVYSRILERFAAPSDSARLTDAYNISKNTEIDSVFVKRYFANRSAGSTYSTDAPFDIDAYDQRAAATLKFDPGWNAFVPAAFNDRPALREDMAVMLVPTNEAFNEWWNNGGGKVIRDFYAEKCGLEPTDPAVLDSVPNSTLAELLNVNMLEQITLSVPSKFATSVIDDANEPMGITTADVDSVFMGCNGAIYMTNRLFSPASFRSVYYPVVVNTTTMNIIKDAIENLDYTAYLNSMVSRYSFFIPTNEGCLTYVDPVSFGQRTSKMWEFHYDDKKSRGEKIYAIAYDCILNEDGTWVKDPADTKGTTIRENIRNQTRLRDRMEDILDNILVIGEVEEGKKYYRTKGNNFVRIEGPANVEGAMQVYGSWQTERNQPLTVKQIYNMQNGRSYVLDGILMGTRKSVADVLAERPECSIFAEMVAECATSETNSVDGWIAASNSSGTGKGNLISIMQVGDIGNKKGSNPKASYLMNAYYYTIYAPTNEAMQKAFDMGLPTMEDLLEAEESDTRNQDQMDADSTNTLVLVTDSAARLRSVMLDFVKYHIQDKSIFVDKAASSDSLESDGVYETAKIRMELNEEGNWIPKRPYKVTVSASETGMTVTDNIGQTHNVVIAESENGLPLYNIQAREYWITGSDQVDYSSSKIDNSSSAVVHLIDGPLVYDNNPETSQFKFIDKEVTQMEVKPRRK